MSSVKLNKYAHSIICETIHPTFFHHCFSIQSNHFVLPPRTNIAAELGEVKRNRYVEFMFTTNTDNIFIMNCRLSLFSTLSEVASTAHINFRTFKNFKFLSIINAECFNAIFWWYAEYLFRSTLFLNSPSYSLA